MKTVTRLSDSGCLALWHIVSKLFLALNDIDLQRLGLEIRLGIHDSFKQKKENISTSLCVYTAVAAVAAGKRTARSLPHSMGRDKKNGYKCEISLPHNVKTVLRVHVKILSHM